MPMTARGMRSGKGFQARYLREADRSGQRKAPRDPGSSSRRVGTEHRETPDRTQDREAEHTEMPNRAEPQEAELLETPDRAELQEPGHPEVPDKAEAPEAVWPEVPGKTEPPDQEQPEVPDKTELQEEETSGILGKPQDLPPEDRKVRRGMRVQQEIPVRGSRSWLLRNWH